MARGVLQKIVALSSCESAYYGMCRTATLAKFVRNVLRGRVSARRGMRKPGSFGFRTGWQRKSSRWRKPRKGEPDIVHLARLGDELSDSTGHRALLF